MRSVLFSVSCVVFAMLAVNQLYAEAVTIVEGGRPHASIVISERASATEKHAADQLAHYVREISGAELPILTAPATPEGTGIFVCTTERCRELGLNQSSPSRDELNEEGFILESGDSSLILSGRTPLGTLFAVYHFLEQVLGCRWLVPGPLGEVIPKATTITVPELRILERPAFDIRAFAMHGSGGRGSELSVLAWQSSLCSASSPTLNECPLRLAVVGLLAPARGRRRNAMARPLRLEFDGALFHVTARGNERQQIVRATGGQSFLFLINN